MMNGVSARALAPISTIMSGTITTKAQITVPAISEITMNLKAALRAFPECFMSDKGTVWPVRVKGKVPGWCDEACRALRTVPDKSGRGQPHSQDAGAFSYAPLPPQGFGMRLSSA